MYNTGPAMAQSKAKKYPTEVGFIIQQQNSRNPPFELGNFATLQRGSYS